MIVGGRGSSIRSIDNGGGPGHRPMMTASIIRSALLPAIVAACALVVSAPTIAAAYPPPSSDETVVPTPRQQQAQDRFEALRERVGHSADLRLRIVHSFTIELVSVPSEAGPVFGPVTHESLSPAELYEQARGTTDPLALDLLLHRCEGTPERCDRVDLARRWTVADTQNPLAWLALADVLRSRGDDPEARDAFVRAALASHWHEHAWDVSRLVADAAPRDLPPLERLGWTLHAATIGFAVVDTNLHTAYFYCREGGRVGGPLREACLTIAATMMRDGDSLMTVLMAPKLAAAAGAADDVVGAYRQRADALYWAALQTAPQPEAASPGDIDDAAAARLLPALVAVVSASERARGERILAT